MSVDIHSEVWVYFPCPTCCTALHVYHDSGTEAGGSSVTEDSGPEHTRARCDAASGRDALVSALRGMMAEVSMARVNAPGEPGPLTDAQSKGYAALAREKERHGS